MRATWLLGGTGALCFVGGAAASPIALNVVVNETTSVDGGNLLNIGQVVAGNNGLVAFFGRASIDPNDPSGGDPYLYVRSGGQITTISAPDSGFNDYSELSLSPDAGLLTYQAINPSGTIRLMQATVNGGTPAALDLAGTNIIDNQQLLNDSHYQVNAAGVAVMKYRTDGTVQNFATASSLVPGDDKRINIVTDPSSHGLKDFNLPDSGVYRRQAIAGDNSVVFLATSTATSTQSVYRLNSVGSATKLFETGSTPTRVVGATSDAVLYNTYPTGSTNHLIQRYDDTTSITLASYVLPHQVEGSAVPSATNAVMTQQNRVAYYNPGDAFGQASVGYYDPQHGNITGIATENQTIVSDGTYSYQVSQISMDQTLHTNPMVNDRGAIVFDTILTVQGQVLGQGESPTQLKAFMAWDVASQHLSIVVKTDGDPNSVYSDTFDGFKVLDLGADTTLDDAGDVLKDGLSEDNQFAFVLVYGNDTEQHLGLGLVAVPEPAAISTVSLAGAALLRRKRRSQPRTK